MNAASAAEVTEALPQALKRGAFFAPLNARLKACSTHRDEPVFHYNVRKQKQPARESDANPNQIIRSILFCAQRHDLAGCADIVFCRASSCSFPVQLS
jgi:hypothetical protein